MTGGFALEGVRRLASLRTGHLARGAMRQTPYGRLDETVARLTSIDTYHFQSWEGLRATGRPYHAIF